MTTELATTEQQAPDPFLALIQTAATDPNFSVEKMQQIVKMRNDELARVAAIDFSRDFSAMQAKLPRVAAVHRNKQTSSDYAKIEDINEKVSPILDEYGFGVMFKIKEQTAEAITIEAKLLHRSGHSESTDVSMPLDNKGMKGEVNKTMIHGTGSTITYAKRYAICSLLNISTGDDNDGNKPVELITDDQFVLLNARLDQTQSNKQIFCETYKIPAVRALPASLFKAAMAQIDKKIEKQNVGAQNAAGQ